MWTHVQKEKNYRHVYKISLSMTLPLFLSLPSISMTPPLFLSLPSIPLFRFFWRNLNSNNFLLPFLSTPKKAEREFQKFSSGWSHNSNHRICSVTKKKEKRMTNQNLLSMKNIYIKSFFIKESQEFFNEVLYIERIEI